MPSSFEPLQLKRMESKTSQIGYSTNKLARPERAFASQMSAIINPNTTAEAISDQVLGAIVSERDSICGPSNLPRHGSKKIAYTRAVTWPATAMKAEYNQWTVQCGQ